MNLRELSARLNLSQTTVSRALNGYPEVNAETRRRVREAAEKYNYVPNMRARTLATGRSMSIGHVIPLSRQDEIVNIVFADFLAGAGAVYGQNGYQLALSIVQDDDELSAYKRITERGAVDGVIVQSPTKDDARITYLSGLGMPFVVHGRSTDAKVPYAWLDVNNGRAIETATEHLIDLGHRRLALLNGIPEMDFAIRRKSGFLSALQKAGITPNPDMIYSGAMSEPLGHAAAMEFLSGDNAPTGIVTSSIVLALGVKRAADQLGLQLGKDLSVVCFDDDISYLPNPGPVPLFTAVKSSVRAAGARCAELMLERIAEPNAPLASELWEAELIIGSSSGPAPLT